MSFEDENNWCLRADSTTNYQDISQNNQTDNAQMFTSIYCKYNWYKKFYVTYNLNGGVCAINPSFYTVNDSFEVKNPTKYGYKFLGWSGSDLNTLTKNLIISNNSTKDTSNLLGPHLKECMETILSCITTTTKLAQIRTQK